MVSIETAREWLRIDGTDNDEIIMGLLSAAPGYIEIATGLSAIDQKSEPLADTVTKFLLTLWYYAEQSETDRLQHTIDSLLKTLTVVARDRKVSESDTLG